ncbi:hypothetical protein [Embleya hyalina]|uniref:Uncharacterized protein n=1 Tax=Embleya hyalina TaxID=516124 RepID=A0A401YQN5_9ACTN|nr:hypothetical protein [Embleya hyalina]GCD96928.1 hypothetical protein EHYA_04615 [Embleya hyalina]
MAQTIASVCDWCDMHGILDVPAITSHSLSLDGPARRVDLCARCEIALSDVAALYDRGQKLPEAHSGVAGFTGGVTEGSATDAGSFPSVSDRDAPGAGSTDVRSAGEGRALGGSSTGKPEVVCPLPHRSTRGGPMAIAYAHRTSHADMVHEGAKVWDIRWSDPAGILTHRCVVHEPCVARDVAFTTAKGLTAHINSCRLPRIAKRDTDRGATAL